MKKSILFLAFTLIILTETFSQSCLPQGITFTTQEQIDNFQINYPSCTVIEGDATIEGNNIYNLDGLSVLTDCNGELSIEFCDSLTNLSGLENINSLGALSIVFNSKITDLTGLNGLTSISSGSLFIYVNTSLTTLSGLNNLSSIENGMEINSNPALLDINGLEQVTSIKSVNIDFNSSLSNLQGLENLSTVEKDFLLHGNNGISDLTGLNNLSTIGGMLSIRENGALTSLSGLNNLDSTAHLYITDNTSLTTCNIGNICNYLTNPKGSVNIYNNATGCNNPTEIVDICGITRTCLPYGNYYFFSQNDINNFNSNYPACSDIMGSVKISGQDINNLIGLNSIISISEDLAITINESLNNLNGFDNLSSIGRNLLIEWNDSLSSISALTNLTIVGNDLHISGNNLNTLSGLDNVSHIGGKFVMSGTEVSNLLTLSNLNYLGGNLELRSNGFLTDLSGLENLSSIGGSLVLYGNDSLQDLKGLENVTSIVGDLGIGVPPWNGNLSLIKLTGLESLIYVGGGLGIYNNDTLEDLIALSNLIYVGENISISENKKLESLEGIENIDTDSIIDLSIFSNPSLSYCEIQSICNYLSIPNGSTYINNNATGCTTQTEVEIACAVLVTSRILEPEIKIYPNPAKTNIFISTSNNVVIKKTNIYNQLGQNILQKEDMSKKMDISKLGQGIYIIEIITDKNIVRRKIIIK